MNTSHIIWDWNGTLLDDVNIVLDATNKGLESIGVKKLTIDEYKENYCVPVYDFYANILGRHPSTDEWETIGMHFDAYYKPTLLRASLVEGVTKLITSRKSQSICSLMSHKTLHQMIQGFNITNHFSLIQGRQIESSREGKTAHLERHVLTLEREYGVKRNTMVLVGDANDDAKSAIDVGIKTVLYSGGTHSHNRLSNMNMPVAKTLEESAYIADCLVNQ
ncbi:HAD family hydrolase (plasmid) [Photobacterium leiognathi subsp. mandapamensis]